MHLNQILRKHLLIHFYPPFIIPRLHVAKLARLLAELSNCMAVVLQGYIGSVHLRALSIDHFSIDVHLVVALVLWQPKVHHV